MSAVVKMRWGSRASTTVALQKRRNSAGGDIGLGVPERIEHTHQGCSLAGKIVQVQQLEPAEARGAQRRLDFLLVAQGLQLARGHQEIAGLGQHSRLLEEVAEDLEIARLERAAVLGNFIEVGVHAPLADLVGDNGYPIAPHHVAVVGLGFWRAGIDSAGKSLSPGLDPRLGRYVELVFLDERPARAAGV